MFLQQLINGIMMGSVYALIALGYSMVYGILRFINFAHSDIYMWGAFFGLYFSTLGLPFPIVLLLVLVCSAALGLLVERIAYKPLRKAPKIVLTASALGMSIVLSNLSQLVNGTGTSAVPKMFENTVYRFGDVSLTFIQVMTFATAVILMIALTLFVNKTRWGKAIRAVSDNAVCAGLMGINFDRIIMLTFVIGSALGGVGGLMVGMYYDAVYATMGTAVGIKAFTAAILGGIGSIPGAMVGGIVLGVVENMGVAFISSNWRDAICFIVMIIVLLFKPSGLFNANIYDKKA